MNSTPQEPNQPEPPYENFKGCMVLIVIGLGSLAVLFLLGFLFGPRAH